MPEFEKLWEEIQNKIDFHKNDEIVLELYDELCRAAVKYTNMRLEWNWFSLEQKQDKDSLRTSYHDRFITQWNMLQRYLTNTYQEYIDKVSDDRKVIGDFACYICYKIAVSMR